ncbi:hypothetical protein ACQ1ZH_14660, partial [Enterococcus faecalis]|uniref:hypothetical protein n=1 Tax=Enterococcus faecalis TaxID=1351 RepID=UPI003D6BB7DD
MHTYTIKDVIGDGKVLGFVVTYFKPHWVDENAESDFSAQEYEKQVYQSEVYRRQVDQDISINW